MKNKLIHIPQSKIHINNSSQRNNDDYISNKKRIHIKANSITPEKPNKQPDKLAWRVKMKHLLKEER